MGVPFVCLKSNPRELMLTVLVISKPKTRGGFLKKKKKKKKKRKTLSVKGMKEDRRNRHGRKKNPTYTKFQTAHVKYKKRSAILLFKFPMGNNSAHLKLTTDGRC